MNVGDVVAGRFVLERLAGAGGMGEVFRAKDLQTGEPVAIKFLRVHRPDDVARFERETKILSEMDDPLVVRYLAHGQLPSGDPFLVMEWIEGCDLASRLAKGPLGAAESVSLCIAIAEALGALHARGIVHRDIKPSNVFLVGGQPNRPKLLDLGVAKVDATSRLTGTGAIIGTAGYMAPEQAKGLERLDPRTDVFSLGCVLFECLAGEPVFTGAHAMALLVKILFEETPQLSQRCAGVPRGLGELIERMLSKDPAGRPKDGRAVASALRGLGEMPIEPLDRVADEPTHPAVLTDSEQRALAVIVVGAGDSGADLDATEIADIEVEARQHGAKCEKLLDGSLAVVMSGSEVVVDLAAKAAKYALALGRRVRGKRRISLAMGRSRITGSSPMGLAIDRATRLVGEVPSTAELPAGVVTLDDVAVGLLDARFDVREESGVRVLAGEREIAEVRMLLGKPTPCVGRERELRALEALFEACVGDECGAQVALVTAPPGAGKSRLGREFLQRVRARDEGSSIWTARGELLRAGSAFGLLSGLIQSAVGLRGGEPLEVRREKLKTRVAARVAASERRRVADFLGELLGAAFPDADSLQLRAARSDAQLMSDQIGKAFLDFLAAESAARTVLIVLEDLHWGDGPTVQVLDAALKTLDDRPIFVFALARPEVHQVFPRLWSGRSVQEIRMQQLSKKAAAELVRHVLGARVAEGIADRIVELADGNAFYLEELIRAAAEGKGDELPETLVSMVQSRIGALDDESRRFLRAASIFGETFWTGGVAVLASVKGRTTAARNVLSELVERELLVKRKETRFPGQDEYTFRHALLREGAYSMLTPEDLSLGHRLAAEWLEAHGEEDSLLLAEHFEKGGLGERAGRHYLRAAMVAHRANDSTFAASCVRRGLRGDISDDLRHALWGELCVIVVWQVDQVVTALPQAEELVRVVPRGSLPWIQAKFVMLVSAMETRRLDDFKAVLDDLLTVDPTLESAQPWVLAAVTGVLLLDFLGRIPEGNEVMKRVLDVTQSFAATSLDVSTMGSGVTAARAASVHEDPAHGLEHGERAIAVYKAIGHRKRGGSQMILAGMNRWLLGLHAQAEQSLVELNMPMEDMGYFASYQSFVLAWVHADLGALDKAREWAEHLIANGQRRRVPFEEGRGHWALAEVLRRAGKLDEAVAEAEASLALLRKVIKLDIPGALATLAAARLRRGDANAARAAAEEGMQLYRSMGACGFMRGAYLRLVHAECLDATGERDAAKAAIGEARSRLLANADKIGDPALRKSFLENVPENRRTLERASEWLGG